MIASNHLAVVYTRFVYVIKVFVFSSFSFSYIFFRCCCCYYCSSSNDCKAMLPHLLFLYTSYIRSRYVCMEGERERERERERTKGKEEEEERQEMELYSDWNKSLLFSSLCEWTYIRLPHLCAFL